MKAFWQGVRKGAVDRFWITAVFLAAGAVLLGVALGLIGLWLVEVVSLQ